MKTKKTSTEKSAKNSGFRSLLPCAKGYRLPSFLTPIFIVLEVTMEVFIPLLMAAIVDGGLYGSPDFTLRKYFSAELIADKTRFVIILGGIMVLAAMLSLAFGMLAARTAAVASMGFAKNLRRKVFEKILSFSFKNTDRFSTPSLVMRTTADINNVQNLYQQMIRIFVRAPGHDGACGRYGSARKCGAFGHFPCCAAHYVLHTHFNGNDRQAAFPHHVKKI